MTTAELIEKAEKVQSELELLAQWAQSKRIGAKHEASMTQYDFSNANAAFIDAADHTKRAINHLKQTL